MSVVWQPIVRSAFTSSLADNGTVVCHHPTSLSGGVAVAVYFVPTRVTLMGTGHQESFRLFDRDANEVLVVPHRNLLQFHSIVWASRRSGQLTRVGSGPASR